MSVVLPAGRPKRERVHHRVLLESTIDMQSEDTAQRKKPNILVTGTPGTGKTTHADLVAAEGKLRHLNISDLVKEHELHDGYDEEFDAYNMNDDKVNDYLESIMEAGGVVVDHHASEFFPERFFDLVVVLRTDNTVLYDRLKARGYADKKIQENVQCEIMHVPAEEAQRSYKPEVVQTLTSNDMDELEQNVERVVEWCRQFCAARGCSL